MIYTQTKLIVKDNSSIKKILCISTFKKKKIKTYCKFKAVVKESKHANLQKGHLIDAILSASSQNHFEFSGKIKKFGQNEAIIIKESKNKLNLVGSRVVGIRNFNLKRFFEKKSFSFNSCK